MADALVSKVTEELASFAAQQGKKEFSLVSGIETKVESLHSKFEAIRAVLVNAEKRQITEESVRRWLEKLKRVSYEMDAALDEWNTAITLRSNLKRLSGKVLFYSHSCFRSNEVHRSGLRRRIAHKIEELKEKLSDISIEKDNFCFCTQNVNGQFKRKTTSSINASEVYGREREKDILLRELLGDGSRGWWAFDIIPLVGTAGIGKTTLAQLVYNDARVKESFDLEIWVYVSSPFNVIMVLRAILEALEDSNAHQLVELEALTNRIKTRLAGRKIFLVLDDVWTEDRGKWEQLEKTLRDVIVESKILVTTRNKRVADMMRVENHKRITLESLSDETCWSIFCDEAFFNRDSYKHMEELVDIGRKIVQKCNGLPLIVKVLGSFIHFKEYTRREWMKVLNSELWDLGDQVKCDLFGPLSLSYYDLPSLEKHCFLYCSYFPKDCMINRDELIELWRSQGLLSNEKDYKEEGIDCFMNLVARSFFRDFEKDDNGNIIGCKMHDLVHDFLMFLRDCEYINVQISSKEDETRLVVDEKVFYCTLVLEGEEAEIPPSIYNKKNLRTLSVSGLNYGTIRWDLLLSLRCLRTLILHNCFLKRLPKNIDKLLYLRHLSLHHRIKGSTIKLPETICNLVNLQTLDLRESVRALPKGIGKLVNLRHLYVGNPIILPKELRKLTSLETLDSIKITLGSKELSKMVMKLEDLSELNNLKGRLSIHIGKVKNVSEAEKAQLKKKEGLVDLDLSLYGSCTLEPEGESVRLLEGLEPNPNLQHLEIRSYYGITMFPSWMISLSNLKSLVLERGRNCEVLGPFGKLPSLESLTISVMPKVKKVGLAFLGIKGDGDTTKTVSVMPKVKNVGLEFLGMEDDRDTRMENCSTTSFPKLKQLEFFDLPSWEEWESESESRLVSSLGNNGDSSCSTIMPALVSLTIRWCYDLKPPLPAFLQRTPLQKLTINNCKYLEQRCQEGMRTEDLVRILTSETSEFITEDTAGWSKMTEATTSSNEISQYTEREITRSEESIFSFR